MKNILSLICILLLCSSCTIFAPPRSGGEVIWEGGCDTVDCVVEEYDKHITGNPESKGPRFKFMEGYRDTPLKVLIENDRLKIEEISPWWFIPQAATLTFVLGYAEFQFGETGDIGTCTAHYMPIPGWKYYLVHELMHCQGYMEQWWIPDGALGNLINSRYSKKQKEIMKEEGVKRWTDTRYYMEEDPTWHDR